VLKKGMREKRGARGVRETLGHGGNGMSFFWREGGGGGGERKDIV
jgi:hypothetical protein